MLRAKPKRQLIQRNELTIGFLILIALLLSLCLWFVISSRTLPWQESPLKVWMLDVGQGDALFIEMPTGEQVLIDGGPDDTILAKLGMILPPWDRSIDAILLTHADADHITGLVSIMDRYDVEKIYETGVSSHSPPAIAFGERVRFEGALRSFVSFKDEIKFGGVKLKVLWPNEIQDGNFSDDRNELSMNILLEYGRTTILFTGDSYGEAEEVVGSRAGDIDMLKVAHHGSQTSSDQIFLNATKPEIALISVGEDNLYGLPDRSVIERLRSAGARVFRTDLEGDVLLISFGDEPIVRSYPLLF